MYDLRATTKNPSHLKKELGDRRGRKNILGTPDRQESNVPGGGEQSNPIVPDNVGQAQAIVPQGVEQSTVRGGDDFSALDQQMWNIQPAASASSQQQWLLLTDTLKLVIVSQALVQLGQDGTMTASYLNLNEDEMAEVNQLLIAESSRRTQAEKDARALTQATLRSAQRITSHNTHEEQIEAACAMNKKNLGDSAPGGYLVQPKNVEAAKKFMRGRAADSQVHQEILKGIERHLGRDYSMETISTILGDAWEDDEDDFNEDNQ